MNFIKSYWILFSKQGTQKSLRSCLEYDIKTYDGCKITSWIIISSCFAPSESVVMSRSDNLMVNSNWVAEEPYSTKIGFCQLLIVFLLENTILPISDCQILTSLLIQIMQSMRILWFKIQLSTHRKFPYTLTSKQDFLKLSWERKYREVKITSWLWCIHRFWLALTTYKK